MGTNDAEFAQRLRATFELEADEHLHTITTGLLELEKGPERDAQRRIIETIFRAAHSLKGAARAVDFTGIEAQCQSLEDTFAAWKRQPDTPSPAALDPVHRTLDAISAAMPRAGRSRPPAVPHRAAPRQPEARPPAGAAPQAAGSAPRAFAAEETVRISVPKLYARLLEAEEMLAAKLTAGQRAEDLRELTARVQTWSTEWTAVEPHARLLRQALDGPSLGGALASQTGVARVLEFLEWNLTYIRSLGAGAAAVTAAAEQDRQQLGKLVDDLLDASRELLLMPFGTLTAPFPKLVRDLCRDLGKQADLVVQGEEIEIDKRILEAMKDPLVHLLRNAVDHGIEMPAERVQAGKAPRGTITLAAARTGGAAVEIVISDDGAGIDIEKVKASAVKGGFFSADNAHQLDDGEARTLIFESEVSTSPIITELSGRGLGLAIVREKTENLGGSLSVESQPRQGTRFSMVLPSTLATFRGILVEAAHRLFILPTLHVQRVVRVSRDAIQTVEGRDTISQDGRAVALVRLSEVLDLPTVEAHAPSVSAALAIVLGTGDGRVAFAVDRVVDEQEVLVKQLRKPLSRVRNVAGATVLSSGDVVPILNVSDLLKSARKAGSRAARLAAAVPGDAAAQKSILVAEDSITSRMLIKGILESAGYRVRTAVDGLEALTLLRQERVDLLVSDVEMPKLNGFDLTAAIRANKRLSELPVVLVTALETSDDRARGIDVGADAYIVKSSFDQTSLLDAVRRLV